MLVGGHVGCNGADAVVVRLNHHLGLKHLAIQDYCLLVGVKLRTDGLCDGAVVEDEVADECDRSAAAAFCLYVRVAHGEHLALCSNKTCYAIATLNKQTGVVDGYGSALHVETAESLAREIERTVAGDGRRLVQHHACQVGCNGVLANQLDGEVGDSLVHNARSVGRVSFDGGVVESEGFCIGVVRGAAAHSVDACEVFIVECCHRLVGDIDAIAVGFNHHLVGDGNPVQCHRLRIGIVCRLGRNVDVASIKLQTGDVADGARSALGFNV